jgi:hypothetical protein
VDESAQDGPIVQKMFVIYRGDWPLRMRIAPSFSGLSVESLSVQGCREKEESSDSVFRSYCLLGCYLKPRLTTVTRKALLSNE